jgi:GNAT superfamily N-acetyltransferase
MSAAIEQAEIRPARDAEARACRMLLPEMFTPTQSPDLLVAMADDPAGVRRLAGAVALGTVHGPADPGFAVLVHVVPPWRRRGIGRALITAAVARCRGRSPVLRAARPVPEESQAAAFLAACGFDRYEWIRHFETDTAAFHADMLRLRQRLGQRVPAAARVVPLRAAPAAAIAQLVSREFPILPSQVLARLNPAAPDAYDLDKSVALLVGEVVGGALIYNWNGGVPVIEVRVVDRALRGAWGNVLMLEQATRNGLEAGATRFRFFADDRLADTMKLARRANAEEIKSERHFWRRID